MLNFHTPKKHTVWTTEWIISLPFIVTGSDTLNTKNVKLHLVFTDIVCKIFASKIFLELLSKRVNNFQDVSQSLNEQNRFKRTCCLFAEAPPTASSMVPVSARVLNDKLISVLTPSDRPPNSMYPGLEKLTVYRFYKTEMKQLQIIFILAYIFFSTWMEK